MTATEETKSRGPEVIGFRLEEEGRKDVEHFLCVVEPVLRDNSLKETGIIIFALCFKENIGFCQGVVLKVGILLGTSTIHDVTSRMSHKVTKYIEHNAGGRWQ